MNRFAGSNHDQDLTNGDDEESADWDEDELEERRAEYWAEHMAEVAARKPVQK